MSISAKAKRRARRGASAVCLACLAGPAAAFSCLFETECYDTEACTEAGFAVEVDTEGQLLGTEFGDLPLVFMAVGTGQMSLVSASELGTYLLTVTAEGARLSMHGEGPFMVNYAGSCEGAF